MSFADIVCSRSFEVGHNEVMPTVVATRDVNRARVLPDRACVTLGPPA